MEENRRLIVVVFAVFAAFGVLTAVIAGAVATQVDGSTRSAFRVVALIAIVLAGLTGYVALAAAKKWWPWRESRRPGQSSGSSAN